MQGAATDPWTSFLGELGKYVAPDWGSLINLLPFLVIGLVGVVLLFVAWRWYAAGPINRERVPRPRQAGSPPPGVHLPGPSRWPFVLPFGAALILFAVVVKPEGQFVNWPVMAIGLTVTVVALGGWYRDATREWRRVEGLVPADHAALQAGAAAGLAGGPAGQLGPGAGAEVQEPPPGVHLPGPSPWPFFIPIGAAFLLFGLVYSRPILIGGLLMTLIAVAGWYVDAGREWRQVEAGHAPEPTTRDPERAFPKALVGVFGLIAVTSIFLAVGPTLGTLPGASAAPSSATGGAAAGSIQVSAKDIKFSTATIEAPAGKSFTIQFTNNDPVQHNIAIFESSKMATTLFRGSLVTGPGKTVLYQVPALQAGTYYFHCDVHPNMSGSVVAK